MTVKTVHSAPVFSGGNFEPPSDNVYNLGSVALSWKDLHVQTVVYATSVAGNWSPSAAATYTLGTTALEWLAAYLADDSGLFVGNDQDEVIYHRVAVLNANTALANVLLGTPVTPAIAANSFILSNTTSNGDILMAGNNGGNSKAFLFFDASAPDLILYQVGGTWTAGATAWVLPAFTMSGLLNPNGNNVGAAGVFYVSDAGAFSAANPNSFINIYGGSDSGGAWIRMFGSTHATTPGRIEINTPNASGAGTIRLAFTGKLSTDVVTFANVTLTGTVITNAASINAANEANGNYFTLGARDSDTATIVEVARVFGAADPYFSFGGSQQFKFTNAGLVGFFAATPVAQQTGCAVPTDLATCITAITALRTALNNLGLTTVV